MDDAPACRDVADPEIFFPERGRGAASEAYRATYAEAQAICASCPIRNQCLEEHLDVPDGIWGGLDRKDRGLLLKAAGRVNYEGRPQFRNMSPFPNDNQVIAQRLRHEAEARGDQRWVTQQDVRMRRREREREERLARSA